MSQESYRYEQRRRPMEERPAGEERSSGARRPAPRRRRRSRALSFLYALLYVVLVIGVSGLLAGLGWTWAGDVLALNKEPHSAVITLPDSIFTAEERPVEEKDEDGTITVTGTETVQAADMDYVADMLLENGLIEYKAIFKIFASLTDARYDLSPGTFALSTDMDYRALISNMGRGSASRQVTSVTLTEGMTTTQIFQKLDEAGVCTADKLAETAASYDFKFSFLKGVVPLGQSNRLEGYLFPDTYEFYLGEDPVSVLNKMILRFDEIFTDDMRALTAERGWTVQDIVTVASMIEKETDGTDQTRISSVIYNRLNNTSYETAGYLGIDATTLYATGGTVVDVNADTPYNTRTHTGLPPTAIANPGAVALRSALYPADENYYYYALGDDGLHHFFRTHDEFQRFLSSQERYQNGNG